jgi:hypothetical protein
MRRVHATVWSVCVTVPTHALTQASTQDQVPTHWSIIERTGVCALCCRYHHLTILVYMYVGGLHWHPYMISGVVWNYGVHAVSDFGMRALSMRRDKACFAAITV